MVVDFSVSDGVAEIVLNDPAKLNAVDEQALADLGSAFESARAAGVRAVILRGEGRAFCAGRDISNVTPATDDALAYLDGSSIRCCAARGNIRSRSRSWSSSRAR